MKRTVSGYIRIISPPAGEAPLWVRTAWVGAVMPVVGICDADAGSNGAHRGAVTRTPTNGSASYMVDQRIAISILQGEALHAAQWWRNQGFPYPDECFGFACSCAEPVGKITELPASMRQFVGILEVGVGAHDHPLNQR